MGAEEEDKKEICIQVEEREERGESVWLQVKLGKEEKVKPCLEKAQPDVNWFIWDGIRGTRANQVYHLAARSSSSFPSQDYQREVEDSSLLDIQSHLASRRQGRLVR